MTARTIVAPLRRWAGLLGSPAASSTRALALDGPPCARETARRPPSPLARTFVPARARLQLPGAAGDLDANRSRPAVARARRALRAVVAPSDCRDDRAGATGS